MDNDMQITAVEVDQSKLWNGAHVFQKKSRQIRTVLVLPEGKTMFQAAQTGEYNPSFPWFHVELSTVLLNKSLFDLIDECEIHDDAIVWWNRLTSGYEPSVKKSRFRFAKIYFDIHPSTLTDEQIRHIYLLEEYKKDTKEQVDKMAIDLCAVGKRLECIRLIKNSGHYDNLTHDEIRDYVNSMIADARNDIMKRLVNALDDCTVRMTRARSTLNETDANWGMLKVYNETRELLADAKEFLK
jgi:hypothetical protein